MISHGSQGEERKYLPRWVFGEFLQVKCLAPCLSNHEYYCNYYNVINFFAIEHHASSVPLTFPTTQPQPTESEEGELAFPKHFL